MSMKTKSKKCRSINRYLKPLVGLSTYSARIRRHFKMLNGGVGTINNDTTRMLLAESVWALTDSVEYGKGSKEYVPILWQVYNTILEDVPETTRDRWEEDISEGRMMYDVY